MKNTTRTLKHQLNKSLVSIFYKQRNFEIQSRKHFSKNKQISMLQFYIYYPSVIKSAICIINILQFYHPLIFLCETLRNVKWGFNYLSAYQATSKNSYLINSISKTLHINDSFQSKLRSLHNDMRNCVKLHLSIAINNWSLLKSWHQDIWLFFKFFSTITRFVYTIRSSLSCSRSKLPSLTASDSDEPANRNLIPQTVSIVK